MTSRKNDIGLLLIRLILGVVFVFHGSQKLFGAFGGVGLEGFTAWLSSLGVPLASVQAPLAAGTEFFGGLALLLGVAVRWVSVPLLVTMLVASFVAHGQAFSAQAGGMEYPLTLAFVLAALSLMGGGEYSLEALINKSPQAESSGQAIPA